MSHPIYGFTLYTVLLYRAEKVKLSRPMFKFSPNLDLVQFLAKEVNSLSAVVFVAVKSVKHKYMYTEHYT